LFIAGLPVSFAIGGLIGFLIWSIVKKKTNRKAIFFILFGGGLYIISQPVSFFVIAYSNVRRLDKLLGWTIPVDGITGCEIIFAVMFAISFTVCNLILIHMMQKKGSAACGGVLPPLRKQ
jgi:hypothetical protein